jgi:hypothetical protein
MKIYVVSAGWSEEFSVAALFSSKELAEKYVKDNPGLGYTYVEAFELDADE